MNFSQMIAKLLLVTIIVMLVVNIPAMSYIAISLSLLFIVAAIQELLNTQG